MLALAHLCLVLTALSALVASKPTSSPTVFCNCTGKETVNLPDNVASGPAYKPQLRINPLEISSNGTGWEEWVFLSHNRNPDGTELIYSYKWGLGDPTSGNVSHQTFIAWAYFPNGTFYRQIAHDVMQYEESADGGFSISIAGNSLTWDPVNDLWNTSINVGGWTIETHTENVTPGIPYAPNYKSVPGQVSDDYFSRIEVPRGHTDGTMTFPWGVTLPVQSVGSIKHTWSYGIMGDTISAYVRGTTFLPSAPPIPVATVNWFQVWDSAGTKEVDSMQYLIQAENDPENQVFRLQVTDVPDLLSVVTTPKPVGLPLSYIGTDISTPMCGPGVNFKNTDKKFSWKVHNMFNITNFVDFAGGSTLYQRVNITGVVWYDGAPVEFAGGVGVVEVYHR